jgi:hypothetical protein
VWCLIDADVHVTLEKPSVYVPVRRTTAAPPPACRRPDARSDWQQPLMLLAPTARERDVVHPPRPVPTPRAHRRSTMDVDGGRRRRRATGTPGRAATGRVGVRVPCSRPVEDHRRFAVVEPPSNGFLAGTAVALGGRAGRHRRAKMMAAGTRWGGGGGGGGGGGQTGGGGNQWPPPPPPPRRVALPAGLDAGRSTLLGSES